MTNSARLKTLLLAAASLTAASAIAAPAVHAAPLAPVTIEHAVASLDHGEADKAAPAPQRHGWAIYAAAAAALAAMARLIGFRRIAAAAAAAGPVVRKAAQATAAAAGDAARATMRLVASPLRFAALLAGLTLIAFTGIGFYDIEWASGLIFGAVIAATALLGAKRLRLKPMKARRSGGR